MSRLYARLFKYKSRLDREPLEDFLSEALADVLARMPRGEVLAFLDFAVGENGGQPFSAAIGNGEIEWGTQWLIPGGIIDIVMFVDKTPVLAIENKTWSMYQDHSGDDGPANQVTTYCRWLARECADHDVSAMLLITATTLAPPGYHGGTDYAVERRGQLTWAAVGRWLQARAIGNADPGITWMDLAADLAEFLKEKGLSSEIFTQSDLSAAHLMLPTMERWRATFDVVWSASQPIWSEFLNTRLSDIAFDVDSGRMWNWRYAQTGRAPPRSWVALGLCFPDQARGRKASGLPGHPYFALIVGSDAATLVPVGPIPGDWFHEKDSEEFVSALPIAGLSVGTDRLPDELSDWSRRAMGEAGRILASCT